MNRKGRIFVSLFFIAALVITSAFAWRARMSVVAAHRAQDQEAARRSEMQKEAAVARKDTPALARRLRASQYEASKLNPLANDTEAFWQRVTDLAAEIRAKKPSQTKNNKDAFLETPGTADGKIVFPELLGDPEYAALAKQLWLAQARSEMLKYLRVANVTAEQRDRLEKNLADLFASEADIQAVAAAMGLDGWNDEVIKQLITETWRKAGATDREIVGKETVAQFKRASLAGDQADDFSHNALTISADTVAIRLSYSAEPLSAEQTRALRNLIYADIDEMSKKSPDGVFSLGFQDQVAMSDAFNEQAAKILSPVQMAGLSELQEEKRLVLQFFLSEEMRKRAAKKNGK